MAYRLSDVNGVPRYTLFYEAKVRDVVQLGNRAPGTIETYQSNYPFQWTEKGWMGPDQKLYPEHKSWTEIPCLTENRVRPTLSPPESQEDEPDVCIPR
jgi:hypothetical protein